MFSLAACLPSCLPPGQRLLSIDIEQDGALMFGGIRGVRDTLPVQQMWGVIQHVPFRLAHENARISSDAQGEACSLDGDVVVRIRHVKRSLLRANLDSLSIRRAKGDEHWRLDASEARRIAEAGRR